MEQTSETYNGNDLTGVVVGFAPLYRMMITQLTRRWDDRKGSLMIDLPKIRSMTQYPASEPETRVQTSLDKLKLIYMANGLIAHITEWI